MTSTKTTTKNEHFFRALLVLAMLASLLEVPAARPAHASNTLTVNFTGDLPDWNVKSITTSVDGLRSFTFTPATSVTVGQAITVTATRNSTHDTSEFSAPRKVVAP